MAEASAVESEDSELAAFLDEGLFGSQEDHATHGTTSTSHQLEELPAANGSEQPAAQQADPVDTAGTQQQAKRQRKDAANGSTDNATQQICPPHPGFCFGMCIRCGAAKPQPDEIPSAYSTMATKPEQIESAMTQIKHLHHRQGALEVSADEAARIATDGVKKLIASRRLVLVLDLDHTLLNTVRDSDLQGAEREAAVRLLKQQQETIMQYRQQLQEKQLQQQQQEQLRQKQQQHQEDGKQQHQQQEEKEQEKVKQQLQQQLQVEQGGLQQDAGTAGMTAAAAAANATESAAVAEDAAAVAPEVPSSTDAGPNTITSTDTQQPQLQHQQQQQLTQPPRPRLYHLADQGLWTKLRPGVEKFLTAVASLYELHIYTMGDKGYAGLMADLLDPEHKLFVGRVVSAADSTRAGVKDLDVLLSDESLVLILDDTEHVWENHKANLIQVQRYHFFGASARLFQPGAQSPLESGTDEVEAGGTLDSAAQLLQRLHARVYGPAAAVAAAATTNVQQEQQQQREATSASEDVAAAAVQADQQQQKQPGRRVIWRPRTQQQQQQQQQQSDSDFSRPGTPAGVAVADVRECLEAELRSILAGCWVSFSRCWPNIGHNPADHPLWQLVLRMGGQCSLNFNAGVTTHVIVAPDKNDPGQVPLTDKVRSAQEAGVPILHPDWLLACKFSWSRQPEDRFALSHLTGAGVTGFSSSRLLGPPPRAAAVEAERAAVMRGAGRTQ